MGFGLHYIIMKVRKYKPAFVSDFYTGIVTVVTETFTPNRHDRDSITQLHHSRKEAHHFALFAMDKLI